MARPHSCDLILKLLNMFLAIILVSVIQSLEAHSGSLILLALLLFAAFYILIAEPWAHISIAGFR